MKFISSDISPRKFLLYANTIHVIVLFVVTNVALAVLFLVKDQLSASRAADKTTTISNGALFDAIGAPIDNGRRTDYQKQWFDYSVYEPVADQVYVGSVLDDFTSLAELGFVYQPWIQFS